MLLTIFNNICTQIIPHFITQRALYEVRERQSKTFSWQVFMLSNIFVEIPWNALMAVVVFLTWYYPIGLRQNAIEADQVTERGALMFLFILLFMIFAGTMTHMVIAGVETAEGAGAIINLLFSFCLIFCGYVTNLPSNPVNTDKFCLVSSQLPQSFPASGSSCTGSRLSPTWCLVCYQSVSQTRASPAPRTSYYVLLHPHSRIVPTTSHPTWIQTADTSSLIV